MEGAHLIKMRGSFEFDIDIHMGAATLCSSLEELNVQPHYSPGTASDNHHHHTASRCDEPDAI